MVGGDARSDEWALGAAAGATDAEKATCEICPHACELAPGQIGRCRARMNYNGVVIAENYGCITSIALDPIEKKPLARFRPGSKVLSVGSYGCNLRCPFCQNASIADAGADDAEWGFSEPLTVVKRAIEACDRGNIGIAYTYNEPFVGYEFVLDCARLAHEAGLANVVVSNGMINAHPLSRILPLIDAANIDLKGPDQRFYDLVGGDVATVRATIEAMAACPTCHVEVTTLVVPGENDSEADIEAIASWLASVDPDIPYHVSRFFPCHRMLDRPPTPVRTVHALADAARRHLRHVYTGNC